MTRAEAMELVNGLSEKEKRALLDYGRALQAGEQAAAEARRREAAEGEKRG